MTELKKVVIAGYARSAFTGAFKGELADVRPDELGKQVVNGLLAKTGVDPDKILDIHVGCAMPEGVQGQDIGHIIKLMSDLPELASGDTINKFCGSAIKAVDMAANEIAVGQAEAVIAGGVESMTMVPMGGFNFLPHPDYERENPDAYMQVGLTAENVARDYNVTREEQDAFAVRSQFKAAAARAAGKFTDAIVPIVKKDGTVVSTDSLLRPDTSLEGLSQLKPAFLAGGTVTAGTSSPRTDGAAFVLVCSEEFAKANKLDIMAEVVATASAGCPPGLMGMGPVNATQRVLKLAGITVDQIDVVEINEAFASQSIACLRELNIPEEKVNLNGGALAIGHPLGATGARLIGTAAEMLKGGAGEYALATQCIGGGQGIATILKKYTPSL